MSAAIVTREIRAERSIEVGHRRRHLHQAARSQSPQLVNEFGIEPRPHETPDDQRGKLWIEDTVFGVDRSLILARQDASANDLDIERSFTKRNADQKRFVDADRFSHAHQQRINEFHFHLQIGVLVSCAVSSRMRVPEYILVIRRKIAMQKDAIPGRRDAVENDHPESISSYCDENG